MDRRGFVSVVIAGMAAIASGAAAQGGPPSRGRPRWGQDAEKEFGLGRGLGPKLMTEEEWKEHHEKMRERAKERGIAMPAEPGPHGRGMGSPGAPPKR